MSANIARLRRPVARALVTVGLLVSAMLALASPAQAHAVLVATTPAAGYSIAGPVQRITLTFSETVSAGRDAVHVTGPTPGLRSVTEPAADGRTLVVASGPLGDGVYRVRWQVTADDGDVVQGDYSFAVGVQTRAGALSGASTAGLTGSLVATAVLRWVLVLGLAVALGGLTGQGLAWRLQRLAAGAGARALPPAVASPVAVGAAVGALGAFGLTVHSLDASSWGTGLSRLLSWPAVSAPGARLPALEVVLFAVAALAVAVPGRWRAGAVVPLLGVALAEGFRGHLREQDGIGGALLIAVHVALAASWTGALVVVLRTAASWHAAGRRNAAWQLVGRFSRAALVVYLLVIGTGTLAAVLLLPSPGALVATGYGRVLCVKLAAVAAVTGLAWRSRRQLRKNQTGFTLTRAHRLQPRVLTGLLALTAVLVSLSPPRLTALAQQPLPPPAPSGPEAQLGGLAGQLTVGLSVSSALVRVQVSTPASDDGTNERFTVTARAAILGQPTRAISLQPCGSGCFAAPVDLAAPGLTVQLEAAASGWRGGRVDLDVPWPLISGRSRLTRALGLMRAARQVTISEQVTSDTSRPAPIAVTVRDSGATFLSTEPYGDPATLPAFLLPPVRTGSRVAFGVGGMYFVELTLDAQGRVAAERLVTPNHLIQRQFRYPR